MRLVALFLAIAFARSAHGADNAAELYIRAAKLITVDSPSASNLEYPGYPPFGAQWDKTEQVAWEQNAPARKLAREARAINRAQWPANDAKFHPLNMMRTVANEVGDASLYEHLHGDDAAAIQSVRDLMHLAKLLRANTQPKTVVHPLVGAGIDALAMYRLMIIAPGLRLSTDASDAKAAQVSDVKKLIAELLDEQWKPLELLPAILGDKFEAARKDPKQAIDRLIESMNRIDAERTMAAMSLACQIFRFEKGRWPESLDELLPAYLPRVPIDPWGDGKQTFGYMLIKGALPGGLSRPLVYCRCDSKDGLSPRTDEPKYASYSHEKHTGQFRDVARWTPFNRLRDPIPDDRL